MTTERACQSEPSGSEQTQGHADISRRLDEIGRAVLRDCDVAAILGLGLSRFYLRKKRGEFRVFEIEQLADKTNTRYSGHLIAEWLRTGDLPRRFFKGATRTTRRGRRAGEASGMSRRLRRA